ncbi:MAG: DUF1007 family protein [Pelagimonas sp.]|jgi:ABC-type uncharacterized transport system substrate-binding protein|nr:DUF1007 family protein [Pelagimonas sp.]
MRRVVLSCTRRVAVLAAVAALGTPANTHPHVFIDGSINFVMGEDTRLEAMQVTWLYDAFETLYMLAAHEMNLNDQGDLDEADRHELVRRLNDWPDDFDGSAHLSMDAQPIPLNWPSALDARLIEGRLMVTFTRVLQEPLDLAKGQAEVAFYESTYFFDFTVTNTPIITGVPAPCRAQVTPFDPDSQDTALLRVLAKLGREETSEIANVGALFADRITLTCD